MDIQDWHKEHWIKTTSKDKFIAWCKVNKPGYSEEEAGLIYDSHVIAPPPPAKPAKNDPKPGSNTTPTT